VGEYRGFDKFLSQIPHPWDKSAIKSPPPPLHGSGFDNTSRMAYTTYFMHETSNLISYSATLLLKIQLLEKSISELDNVNCPRGGDKKQCQIPTRGVGTPRGGA